MHIPWKLRMAVVFSYVCLNTWTWYSENSVETSFCQPIFLQYWGERNKYYVSIIISCATLTKTSIVGFDIDIQIQYQPQSLNKRPPELTLSSSQDIPRSDEHGDVVRAPIIALDRNFDLVPFASLGREESETQLLTDTLDSICRSDNRVFRGVRHILVFNMAPRQVSRLRWTFYVSQSGYRTSAVSMSRIPANSGYMVSTLRSWRLNGSNALKVTTWHT